MNRPLYVGLYCLIATAFLLGACGQPEPIAVSVPTPIDLDATRFLNGSKPTALLFDGEHIWVAERTVNKPGAVKKLRASDGEVLGTFTVGRFPSALAFDGENIWVYNDADETLTKLRASDGEVLGTFKVGPESGYFGSSSTLLFDGQHIWVPYSTTQRLVQVRTSDGHVLRTLRFDASPSAVALARDTMLRFDLRPGALGFDGEHIWVANKLAGTLMVLRASDAEVLRTVSFDGRPSALAFDGEHFWVANPTKGTVAKMRAGDGSLIASYSPGGFHVSFAAGSIWVATREHPYITIIRFDPAGNALAAYRVHHPSNKFFADGVVMDFAFAGNSIWMVLKDTEAVIKAEISP